jgi:4-hydroxy-4-methyl-2-oxoglutarate aldolase
LAFDRLAVSALEAARKTSSATVHEAYGRRGQLPHEIKPVWRGVRVCGPAFTVHAPPGDNLWIHRAMVRAQPGDVLVVAVSNAYDYGAWGELMSTAAQCRALGGLVIDGCVRDGALLQQIGFPVFARGLCIRGTVKDASALGWCGAPVLLGDTVVRSGDLILGDDDGLVCVSNKEVEQVLQESRERDEREAQVIQRLNAGETLLDIMGRR